MSILIPLLLPSVLNATANVALGITNAVQGTSSNFSIKVGNKVFTTSAPFPFERLPAELRMEIIEMALEMSKDLILPPMDFVPGFQPLGPTYQQAEELHRNNPLNPDNPHYRSIVGEARSANGYPLSSWHWTTLNSEWNTYVRRRLWRKCCFTGIRTYQNFEKLMKRPGFEIFKFVHELELHQGFGDPAKLYALLRHPQLTNLESISIMPLFPWSPSPFEEIVAPFPFGLQLIPVPSESRPRLKHLTLGMPLEMTTNAAQRQHLAELAPEKLTITVLRPSKSLFQELASRLPEVIDTLSIRYLNINMDADLVDPAIFVSPILDIFKHVHLHLPARASSIAHHNFINRPDPSVTFADRVVDLILADKDRQEKYTVWIEEQRSGFNLDLSRREQVLYQPQATEKDKVLFDVDFDFDAVQESNGASSTVHPAASTSARATTASSSTPASSSASNGPKGKGKEERVWDRETNLQLLGGLISLRMESKKR